MKNLKFKSLTMRIWTTFTIIILIIILSISLIYLVLYKKANENARIEDLKVAHDIILDNNNYDEPVRFDELRNLKGSKHFVFQIEKGIESIIEINNFREPPEKEEDVRVKLWMASFIDKDTLKEKQFKKTYKNEEFLFFISSIELEYGQKSYLISYLPNNTDNSLLYLVCSIGLVFIAIGFLTAKLVANYISKPLKELEDYTVKISQKDWKQPIIVNSKDEIGRLGQAMNRMQRELMHADEEEKMFLQSISHDLKTPVMVIMSHAEAIIDGVYIDSVEDNARIIIDESISLEKKIKQLLYLNTLNYVLDNGYSNEEINLKQLLQHIINRFEIINSKIEWELDLEEVNINANMEKLQISIENILDNALRYAESKIMVSSKKLEDYAQIEIYNDGPHIKEQHIAHIFDNQYKDKTGNFGLGLAISKKIVDYYNGEIFVLNREKGVSFILNIYSLSKR